MATEVLATKLVIDRIQTRENTNSQLIDDYAEQMKAGDKFPPITVVTDGKSEWLTDGIHRLDAAIKAKVKISVDYVKGNRITAVEMACGANAIHGLRRSNADKRRAVRLALKEFGDRSDRMIADLCCVGHPLVAEVRAKSGGRSSTCANGSAENPEEKRIGRDGKAQAATKKEVGRDGIIRKVTVPTADSFDPDEIDAQPVAKPPKNAKPVVSVKDRKDCLAHLGGLIRALNRVGILDEFEPVLNQISGRLKEL